MREIGAVALGRVGQRRWDRIANGTEAILAAAVQTKPKKQKKALFMRGKLQTHTYYTLINFNV